MRYCSTCGTQLAGDTRFCPNCGTEQGRPEPIHRNTGARKRLHCPNCKGTALIPVTESTGSIGSVGRLSRNTAIVGTDNINKSYWMCQECGHKFRNLEDFIKENKRTVLALNIVLYGMLVFCAILSIFMGLITSDYGMMFAVVLMCAVFSLCVRFFINKMKLKWEKDERALRKACFD